MMVFVWMENAIPFDKESFWSFQLKIVHVAQWKMPLPGVLTGLHQKQCKLTIKLK